MQWADDFKIETPEQIDVSLEVAGLGSRFVAKVCDWLIKMAWIIIVALLLAVAATLIGLPVDEKAPMMVLAVIGVMIFAFMMAFDIFYEVRKSGQTPGKRMAGIRVIRESGAPVDFRSSCIRNLLALADLLPGFYLLGGFLVLLSARGQRLGDMAAGTIVIRERAEQAPRQPNKEVERLASEEIAFTGEQLAACSPADRHILREFFQRYRQLQSQPRHQLACRLVEQFARKTAYPTHAPIEDGIYAEEFLASLYRDLENKARHDR